MAKATTRSRKTSPDPVVPPPQPPPLTMGAVQQLPVARMARHPRNQRAIPVTDSERNALIASVRAIGVLVPVMVEVAEDGYLVLAGWQRVCAAVACGHQVVPAIQVVAGEAEIERLSVAENLARSPMHVIDQWRTVDTMMRGGLPFDQAAAAVGATQREAGQMRLLANLAPELLDAMRASEVPSPYILGRLANTPVAKQVEALAVGTITRGKGPPTYDWRQIYNACRVERISRTHALFAHKDSGVVFDKDLFAAAGSDDEWTTTDVEGFRRAQRNALSQLISGHDRADLVDWSDHHMGPMVPTGWHSTVWFPKVPKTPPYISEGCRFVVAMKPDGQAVARMYRVPLADAADAPSNRATQAAERPVRMITDAGLQLAADMKQHALRAALGDVVRMATKDEMVITMESLTRLLLISLDARNVSPGSAAPDGRTEMINAMGIEGVARVAVQTIGEMLVFPAPKVMMHSGPVADYVARSVGAERHLPRFDTPEFLAECSGAMLREAAALVPRQPGQKLPSSVAGLRTFLAGKLPDWRPVGFGGVEGDHVG